MPNLLNSEHEEKPKISHIFPSIDDVIDNLYSELVNSCPGDIYQFCFNYFFKKLESQRKQLLESGIYIIIYFSQASHWRYWCNFQRRNSD